MKVDASSFMKVAIAVAGSAVAGPAGTLIGGAAGGLLSAAVPQFAVVLGNMIGNISAEAIRSANTHNVDHLNLEEKKQVGNDLQIAFQDAFRQAIYDIGGSECFAEDESSSGVKLQPFGTRI